MTNRKVAVVIPARFASTRFPGKPLVKIAGQTMIERVYKQALKTKYAHEVVVATDDLRIAEEVTRFGGTVIMTSSDHPTGTDRLAEVASKRPDIEIIVNVQGDEPLIDPSTIDRSVQPLVEDATLDMSTIAAPITNPEEIQSNSIVKVVRDQVGNALYFSRFPIPFHRDSNELSKQKHFAHIGLYVYRRDILLRLASLPPTPLEQAEALEQLRALENGIKIRVVDVAKRSPAVDRPEDVETVEQALKELNELDSKSISAPFVSATPNPVASTN